MGLYQFWSQPDRFALPHLSVSHWQLVFIVVHVGSVSVG